MMGVMVVRSHAGDTLSPSLSLSSVGGIGAGVLHMFSQNWHCQTPLSDCAAVQCLLQMAAHPPSDVSRCGPVAAGLRCEMCLRCGWR